MKTSSFGHNQKRTLATLAAAAALVLGALSAQACGETTTNLTLLRLAHEALSDNPARTQSAIAALRDAGPAGLNALFKLHASVPQPAPGAPPASAEAQGPSRAWMSRLTRAMDEVGRQRDCLYSQLYW